MAIRRKSNVSLKVMLLCLLATLCCLASASYAKNNELISIQGENIQVLVDSEHAYNIQDIIQNKGLSWERSKFETPTYGFSPHTYWFRFTLRLALSRVYQVGTLM